MTLSTKAHALSRRERCGSVKSMLSLGIEQRMIRERCHQPYALTCLVSITRVSRTLNIAQTGTKNKWNFIQTPVFELGKKSQFAMAAISTIRLVPNAMLLAHLRCIYGFTCKCRSCADPVFSVLSDRRHRMLKNDFFCGINGMPVAPDFSAKAHGTEDPNSIRPTKIQFLHGGFSNGMQIFRPGTVQLMRRAVKLWYDEGLGDNSSEINVAASSALCVMHKRMIDSPRRVPRTHFQKLDAAFSC